MQCLRIIKKKETKLFLDYNLPKNDNCQKRAYVNVSCLGIFGAEREKKTHICTA